MRERRTDGGRRSRTNIRRVQNVGGVARIVGPNRLGASVLNQRSVRSSPDSTESTSVSNKRRKASVASIGEISYKAGETYMSITALCFEI